MTPMDLLTALTSIIAAVVTAVFAVRKAAPGMMASLVRRSAEADALERHPVVIVGDEVARLEVYELLVGLRFRSVRCTDREGYSRKGQEAVVLLVHLAKRDGEQHPTPTFDLRSWVAQAGVSEGLLYVKGQVAPPSGRWTFANSEISLHARLLELVRFIRAAAA